LRKYGPALENLKKAEALMPESMEVPYNLALLHEAQGQTDEAIQDIQEVLGQTSKSDTGQYSPREKANRAILLERLGVLYRSTENYTAAEETFRQMLENDQENAVRGATQLVETLRQAKELPRALAEAEAALQRFPEERSLMLTHVSLLGESGQGERASQMLRAMLQDKPGDREVLLTLAQVNERAKRYREAEQAIAAAEKYSSRQEEKEFVHFLWGSILERQKKYNGAEEQFQKALAINPQSAMTLNYLGYMLADRGVRLEEAKRYIQAALEQDPNNGAYLDSLGWVFYKLDQLDLAEQNLLKAVQRISRDATIHDHLGDVYYRTGRIREALIHWQKALAEWSRALPSEADPKEVAKIQKKLEGAKVRLARETGKKRD
jgi:tetratricopeptide (TPR) repeat protein